jgi:hypothetical protein
MKKSVLGVFGVALATVSPTVPAAAAPTSACYDAILWCKYHPGAYSSFEECIEQESRLRCPAARSAGAMEGLIARPNGLPGA